MRKANMTISGNPNVVYNNNSNRKCSSRPPPFLAKLYQMVRDPETNDIVSWSLSKQSFIIWDRNKFSSLIIPMYFKHNSFHCFQFQLKKYGFNKVDWEPIEFANPMFVEGREDWLMMIRRKCEENIDVVMQRKDSLLDRSSMETTMELLQHEKMNLELQLEELKEKQKNLVDQFVEVEDNIKHTTENQETFTNILISQFVQQSIIQHLKYHKENDRIGGK